MFDLTSLIMPPEKVAQRRNTIGASDMPVIMGSDEERLLKLWRFKCGGEPEDLSDVLPVLLGSYTEPFNLALFARRSGLPVEPCAHSTNGIMSASPDGIADGNAVIDAKHCGTFKSEAELGAYYCPQLFAQMHVTGKRRAFLSVIRGNADLFWLEYQWDDAYGARVIEAAEAFWRCVQDKVPPCPLPPAPSPKPIGIVEYNMEELGSNEWASHAADYTETVLAADRHEIAKKALKALVPDDASKCFGHGIEIRRAKNGSLRFYEGEQP